MRGKQHICSVCMHIVSFAWRNFFCYVWVWWGPIFRLLAYDVEDISCFIMFNLTCHFVECLGWWEHFCIWRVWNVSLKSLDLVVMKWYYYLQVIICVSLFSGCICEIGTRGCSYSRISKTCFNWIIFCSSTAGEVASSF